MRLRHIRPVRREVHPRSTVGTTTEIYDYLRLLFARIGHPHCPICGREISRMSVEQIVEQIKSLQLSNSFIAIINEGSFWTQVKHEIENI